MEYAVTSQTSSLKATVSTFGAELSGLGKVQADGSIKNVIWTPDNIHWNRTEPTLFPTIGRSANDKIVIDGNAFPMPKHGLTNKKDWEGTTEADGSVTLQTSDTEDTRPHFPFPFTVRKRYSLDNQTLTIRWDVESDVDMPFMMGGHPAFALPDYDPNDDVHGFLQLAPADDVLASNVVLPDGYLHPETTEVRLSEGGILPLTNHTFDCDTLLDIRGRFTDITLLDKQHRPVATVHHDMPVLAIWAPNGGRSPFVCIEPWCGCCEDMPTTANAFEERRFIQHVREGKNWSRSYTIHIY